MFYFAKDGSYGDATDMLTLDIMTWPAWALQAVTLGNDNDRWETARSVHSALTLTCEMVEATDPSPCDLPATHWGTSGSYYRGWDHIALCARHAKAELDGDPDTSRWDIDPLTDELRKEIAGL